MLRPTERRQHILSDIDHIDDNMIPQLSEKYGVSEMTIRRDLKLLEEDGVIKRTYGGAVRWSPHDSEQSVIAREEREVLSTGQKINIARYAAEHYVSDGDIIILEGGTTTTMMVPFLIGKEGLTIVTNGLRTAGELWRLMADSAMILCAGGILRAESQTFVGPLTEHFFAEINANRLFLSATGLTLEKGITDPNILETQVKRAMIESASEVVVMLDSSKFGRKSLMRVLEFPEIDHLITDWNAPQSLLDGLRQRDVDVQIVPPPREGMISDLKE